MWLIVFLLLSHCGAKLYRKLQLKASGWSLLMHAKLLRSTFDRKLCGPTITTSACNSSLQPLFGVSHACLETLLYGWRTMGEVTPWPWPLPQAAQPQPDATLEVLCIRLRQWHVQWGGVATMCRMLKCRGLLRNKSRSTPTNASLHRVHQARTANRKRIAARDLRQLMGGDESKVELAMSRLDGRIPSTTASLP
jgi:hypothetical protein